MIEFPQLSSVGRTLNMKIVGPSPGRIDKLGELDQFNLQDEQACKCPLTTVKMLGEVPPCPLYPN